MKACVLLGMWLTAVSLAAADCDGDGVEDAAETAVTLTFAEIDRVVVGHDPTTLAALDVDQDGLLDIAAACTKSNSVAVCLSSQARAGRLLGDGEQICVGVDPRGIAFGDVNGDGAPDLVCGFERRASDPLEAPLARATVLAGSETGAFSPACPPPCIEQLPATCFAGDLAVFSGDADGIRTLELVDLDQDRGLDLLLGFRSASGQVGAQLSDGKGGLGAPFALHGAAFRGGNHVKAADLDGDGLEDVATAGGDVLFGPTATRQGPQPDRIAGPVGDPRAIAVTDIDGDALPDLLLASTSSVQGGAGAGRLLVLRNRGGRLFDEIPQSNLAGLCDLLESAAASDMDGDGDIDLALPILFDSENRGCPSSGITLLENDGAGRYSDAGFVSLAPGRPRWILAADFNGDGLSDLAAATVFAEPEPPIVIVLANVTKPSAADGNRNKVPDACEYSRGDVDRDRALTVTDAVVLLRFLFLGAAVPSCLEACDVNDDGAVQISDAVALLAHLFQGALAPPAPGLPGGGGCVPGEAWSDPSGNLGCSPCGK